jgi:hypothetical protein
MARYKLTDTTCIGGSLQPPVRKSTMRAGRARRSIRSTTRRARSRRITTRRARPAATCRRRRRSGAPPRQRRPHSPRPRRPACDDPVAIPPDWRDQRPEQIINLARKLGAPVKGTNAERAVAFIEAQIKLRADHAAETTEPNDGDACIQSARQFVGFNSADNGQSRPPAWWRTATGSVLRAPDGSRGSGRARVADRRRAARHRHHGVHRRGRPDPYFHLLSICMVGGDSTAATLQWSADGTVGAATTFTGRVLGADQPCGRRHRLLQLHGAHHRAGHHSDRRRRARRHHHLDRRRHLRARPASSRW